ncbi:hypothetical protein PIB30_004621 [Stylosanthes scabra]|uniref:Uncharacterized protein n=1 Tax=Stylosanthes scabra TaxID=79078 RepID=A0ABU6Z0J6_9FABA|nr:hypothetical protein [Stylosanthes scabra]
MAVINILFEASALSLNIDPHNIDPVIAAQLLGSNLPEFANIPTLCEEHFFSLPEAHMTHFKMGPTSFLGSEFSDPARTFVVDFNQRSILSEDRFPHPPASLADAAVIDLNGGMEPYFLVHKPPLSEGGLGLGFYRLRFDFDFENEADFYWDILPSPPLPEGKYYDTYSRAFVLDNHIFLKVLKDSVGSFQELLFSFDTKNEIWTQQASSVLLLFYFNQKQILPDISLHVEGVTNLRFTVYLATNQQEIYAVGLHHLVGGRKKSCYQRLEGCFLLPPFTGRAHTKVVDLGDSNAAAIALVFGDFEGVIVPVISICVIRFAAAADNTGGNGFLSFNVENRFLYKIVMDGGGKSPFLGEADNMVDCVLGR